MDIIILIFLARDIGRIARSKGLRPSTWRIYLVIGWITMEIFGLGIGLWLFGKDNLVSVGLVALGAALSSYFTLRSVLYKYPDAAEDEIDHIGKT